MVPVTDLRSNEESVVGDIASLQSVENAMRGMDAVIHLAAEPVETAFEKILAPTSSAPTTCSRRRPARRQAHHLRPSNHAVGFYPRTQRIDHDGHPRPTAATACARCSARTSASLYADKYGIRSMHIRIGNAADPLDKRPRARHLGQRRAISRSSCDRDRASRHPLQIVYGISNNAAPGTTIPHAYRLGYKPLDKSEDYTAQAMAAEAEGPKSDPVALQFQGGPFCSIEYVGPPKD